MSWLWKRPDASSGVESEDGLEQKLRAGLRPRMAPEGFADRVLARLEASEGSADATRNATAQPRSAAVVHSRLLHHQASRWAVAAALLMAVTLGGLLQHERTRERVSQQQQRIAGEHARQQVLLALRITSTTLQAVRSKVAASNRSN